MPKVIPDRQIFHSVMQIIAERGYGGATTRQIAESAGVSEVTLFRKFGTKAELVKRAISALVEQTEFDRAAHYTGDVRADLLRVVQAYQAAVILHERFFFGLFAELSRTPELADSISEPLGLFRSIAGLLSRYQADGVLKPENTLHGAASLLGPLIYYSMIARTAGDASMPAMEIDALVTFFLDGRVGSESSPRLVE